MIIKSSLIARCCNQDRAAQKQLYLDTCDYLMHIIYRYVGDIELSKDVLQNTYIKIYGNITSYDENQAAFKTWIHRIAVNESITFMKKKNRHLFEEIKGDVIIERDTVDINFQLQDVLSIIHKLPDTYRSILNLYHIEEFSHDEIANMLGIKASSSRAQLARAKKMLNERYLLLNTIRHE